MHIMFGDMNEVFIFHMNPTRTRVRQRMERTVELELPLSIRKGEKNEKKEIPPVVLVGVVLLLVVVLVLVVLVSVVLVIGTRQTI